MLQFIGVGECCQIKHIELQSRSKVDIIANNKKKNSTIRFLHFPACFVFGLVTHPACIPVVRESCGALQRKSQ